MNEKFYTLPQDRQKSVIEAGFQVFSLSSYKKTPVSQVAAQANMSKSLLFHYFHNKKELYLFLWERAARLTIQALDGQNCYTGINLFDQMERGMEAKFQLIRRYPYMANFVLRAFYEKDPDVHSAIEHSFQKLFARKEQRLLASLNPEDYRPGLDLTMMYRQMYWAAEGYLWQVAHQGPLNPAEMEKDFRSMLAFWRQVYENPEKSGKNPSAPK